MLIACKKAGSCDFGAYLIPLLWDARPAGWVTYCTIYASTMPRAQNRAEKGSIMLWRRLALAILLLFIYGGGKGPETIQFESGGCKNTKKKHNTH